MNRVHVLLYSVLLFLGFVYISGSGVRLDHRFNDRPADAFEATKNLGLKMQDSDLSKIQPKDFKVQQLYGGDNDVSVTPQNIPESPAITPSQNLSSLARDTETVAHTVNSQQFYLVTRVVDGDTFDVLINGTVERVRSIGMDTPETVDPRKPVQCFGKEASKKAAELLLNKKVRLDADPTQDNRDKYDRLLRYVHREDDLFFNKWMIEHGYAHEYTYIIPYTYQDDFMEAQKVAREQKNGFWSSCPVAIQESQAAAIVLPPTAPQQQTACTIKGNISASAEKIYHLKACDFYSRTKIDEFRGERWFCSEAEAVAAGWRKAKNCR